jgi:uronate dehydrogenase
MRMNIAITGANGLIGGSLINELDPGLFSVTPIDLPDVDATNYRQLLRATKGADALIHLAWKDLIPNVQNNTVDPANMCMVDNAYGVAAANGIHRIIMGSSNQAHGYDITDSDGRIRPTTAPDAPANAYGQEKLEMEALGKEYATKYGLEVVCLRIGNVNSADLPKPTIDGRPQRWLSKRDLGRLVSICLQAEVIPDNFQVVYGVSNGSIFDWVNPFGFRPLDTAARSS